jgi:hypothetical protein
LVITDGINVNTDVGHPPVTSQDSADRILLLTGARESADDELKNNSAIYGLPASKRTFYRVS